MAPVPRDSQFWFEGNIEPSSGGLHWAAAKVALPPSHIVMPRLQRVTAHITSAVSVSPAARARAAHEQQLVRLGFQREAGSDSLVQPSHLSQLRDEGYTIVTRVIAEPWLQRLR